MTDDILCIRGRHITKGQIFNFIQVFSYVKIDSKKLLFSSIFSFRHFFLPKMSNLRFSP